MQSKTEDVGLETRIIALSVQGDTSFSLFNLESWTHQVGLVIVPPWPRLLGQVSTDS